jgi:uncharacterized protein (DUF2141 family)
MVFRFLRLFAIVVVLIMANPIIGKSQAATLTIKVTNVKSTKGKVLFALFSNAEGFPGSHTKAFRLADSGPVVGATTVVFENLPSGTYALAVFHDENNDGKLNTNLVGIPKEPYGFSNNARPSFSAPSFKEASFSHKGPQTLSIQVK